MNYWTMKRHGGNLDAYCQLERKQSEKATCYVIPISWHSGNGETLEILNILVIAEGEIGVRGMNTQHREFSCSENTFRML